MEFEKVTPILRMFDEFKAREFYVDFLEFKIDWEHRFEDGFPLYMQVSKGHCTIHLTEHHGDASPGAAIRIPTVDVEEYQKYLLNKKYKNARPGIVLQPWDSKEMSITDPFGNKLVFFETIS